MNPDQLLEQLAPLRTPEAIGIWPLALGWWVVIGLLVAAAVVACFGMLRRHRRTAYRRSGAAWLLELEHQDADLRALSGALKATAIKVYDPSSVASLSGEAWPEFLRSTCVKLDQDALDILANVHAVDPDQPSTLDWYHARQWMKLHEVAHA